MKRLEQEQNLKRKWSCFAMWINATTDNLLDRNQNDTALTHYDKTLKFKVFRSFLTFLGQK